MMICEVNIIFGPVGSFDLEGKVCEDLTTRPGRLGASSNLHGGRAG